MPACKSVLPNSSDQHETTDAAPAACDLDVDWLRSEFNLCPLTGRFVRARDGGSGGRLKAGTVAGYRRKDGYRRISLKGKDYLEHRLVWFYVHGVWPAQDTDHVNGIRDDNRPENLRDISHQVNMQNRVEANATSKSGLLGVYFNKQTGKWTAQIRTGKGSWKLGSHDTPHCASKAYVAAKTERHPGAIQKGAQ